MRKILVISLGLAVFWGCGRDNKVTPADRPAPSVAGLSGRDGAQGPPGENGRNYLPIRFYNHSVGRALVDVSIDGVSANSVAIRLQTADGANAAGEFNGPGTGNKAILGLSQYHQKKLDELASITFDAKIYTGTLTPAINVIVDLHCDGTLLKILEADASTMIAPVASANGYLKYSAFSSDSAWRAFGGIADPANVGQFLVPDMTSASGTSLAALLLSYPQACLTNTVTTENEMPKDLPVSAIMLVLGDSSTVDLHGTFINHITVNDDTYESFH